MDSTISNHYRRKRRRARCGYRDSLTNSFVNLLCASEHAGDPNTISGEIPTSIRNLLLPIRFVPRLAPIRAKDIAIPFIRYPGNNLRVCTLEMTGVIRCESPDAILKPLRSGVRKWMLLRYAHLQVYIYVYIVYILF